MRTLILSLDHHLHTRRNIHTAKDTIFSLSQATIQKIYTQLLLLPCTRQYIAIKNIIRMWRMRSLRTRIGFFFCICKRMTYFYYESSTYRVVIKYKIIHVHSIICTRNHCFKNHILSKSICYCVGSYKIISLKLSEIQKWPRCFPSHN